MPYYTDTPDTIICSITQEGRNLLARSKLGSVVFKQTGWQAGLGGYEYINPVKVTAFSDTTTEAVGSIRIIGSNVYDAGDMVVLNGKQFIYLHDWTAGISIQKTAENVRDAILNSTDPAHYRLVVPYIDPLQPDTIQIISMVTGEIGNHFPISAIDVGSTNFEVTPMSGGTSIALENAAYPVPPIFNQFYLPDGKIETIPQSYYCYVTDTWYTANNTASFVMRIPDGAVGLNAYGELGIWAEVLISTHPDEVGRKVLFAHSHFPIKPKTDRDLFTFRVIIQFLGGFMVIHKDTPGSEGYRVHDCTGRQLPFVVQYDTDTKEITVHLAAGQTKTENEEDKLPPIMFIPAQEPNQIAPVTVSFVLAGSFATYNGAVVSPVEPTPEVTPEA